MAPSVPGFPDKGIEFATQVVAAGETVAGKSANCERWIVRALDKGKIAAEILVQHWRFKGGFDGYERWRNDDGGRDEDALRSLGFLVKAFGAAGLVRLGEIAYVKRRQQDPSFDVEGFCEHVLVTGFKESFGVCQRGAGVAREDDRLWWRAPNSEWVYWRPKTGRAADRPTSVTDRSEDPPYGYSDPREVMAVSIDHPAPAVFVGAARDWLAYRLGVLAEDQGMSGADIAEQAGVSPRMVTTLMSGRASKGLDDLLRCIWALGVFPEDAFATQDDEEEFSREYGAETEEEGLDMLLSRFKLALDAEVDRAVSAYAEEAPRATAVLQAKQLVEQAAGRPGENAMGYLSRALELDPLCAEAYLGLLALGGSSESEMLRLLRRALEAAQLRLPAEVLAKADADAPGMETYLRCRTLLAEALHALGDVEEAVLHLREICSKFEVDVGVRARFGGALLELRLYDEYRKLIADGVGGDPLRCYLGALGDYVLLGPEEATASLLKSLHTSADAARALAGEGPQLEDVFRLEGMASKSFGASMVGLALGPSWARTPGAMQWLKQVASQEGIALVDFVGAKATRHSPGGR